MREYRCRYCDWYLFRSDAAGGRLTITCPSRRCRRQQTLQLAPESAPIKPGGLRAYRTAV